MRYELTQDLLTGNQLIDSEHRQLFDAINALLDACAQGAGRTKINETVQFLNSYVSKHFRDEEQLQLQSKYPGYNAHHTFHEGYKRELAAAANQIGAEGPSVKSLHTLNTLVGTLITHIRTEDKRVEAVGPWATAGDARGGGAASAETVFTPFARCRANGGVHHARNTVRLL